jgi:hypothetical protein
MFFCNDFVLMHNRDRWIATVSGCASALGTIAVGV